MSAFAVNYERSNTPVEPGVLERALERLSHRGPDGCDFLQTNRAALGHWHFWTTPEEVGERQPLKFESMPFIIVMDGRLDNRTDLISDLKIDPMVGKDLSDTTLALHAYDRWGPGCFSHFIGEFAMVILDEKRDELVCARDVMGGRTLFYAVSGTRILVASEAWAIAGSDGSTVRISEQAAAYFFAFKSPDDGQTLFKNVSELLPATVLIADHSGERTSRYWLPDPSKKLRGLSDEEYASQFRLLLENSIRCRLRSSTPVGVLMSGGLDSGSVACLAARMLAPKQLTTFSYVFDELAECDERSYIESIKTQWGINSIQIPCDDAWPLKDWQKWPHNPNQPERNPYRLLKELAYGRAHEEGIRTLLIGAFGDSLYSRGKDWLADLFIDGCLPEAIKELSLHIWYTGLYWTIHDGYLQRLVRRLLDLIPGGRHIHRKGQMPAWLTAFSTDYLNKVMERRESVLIDYDHLVGLWAARGCSEEIFNANRHALELRDPYRDQRLVEFVMTLPGYQLYHRGLYKRILRNAMQGILPEIIRTRRQPTSLISLYSRGIMREKNLLQACFQGKDAIWQKYVDKEWLAARWKVPVTPAKDGPELVVPWLCVSFESWCKFSELSV